MCRWDTPGRWANPSNRRDAGIRTPTSRGYGKYGSPVRKRFTRWLFRLFVVGPVRQHGLPDRATRPAARRSPRNPLPPAPLRRPSVTGAWHGRRGPSHGGMLRGATTRRYGMLGEPPRRRRLEQTRSAVAIVGRSPNRATVSPKVGLPDPSLPPAGFRGRLRSRERGMVGGPMPRETQRVASGVPDPVRKRLSSAGCSSALRRVLAGRRALALAGPRSRCLLPRRRASWTYRSRQRRVDYVLVLNGDPEIRPFAAAALVQAHPGGRRGLTDAAQPA